MRRALALLAALLMVAPVARANMASPTEPGTPAGEPPTALQGLRVARERLVLDLTPLGRARSRGAVRFARIEAEYLIVNDGAARRVPLAFVALGDDVEAAQVWLDGEPVAARRLDALPVPDAWRIATETPPLGDGEPAPFETDRQPVTGFGFALDVPPGRHRVRVAYRVRAGSYDSGAHPNRVWQIAYSLAPARFWAGFGALDVTIRVPGGWDAAASLPLRREGGALVGQFAGVPGDVLTVSARAAAPVGRLPLRIAAFLSALALFGLAGWIGGRWTAARGRPARWALASSFLGGVAGAAAFTALTLTADGLGDSSAFGYGAAILGVLVVGPLAVVLGTALAQTVAVRTHRRYAS